MSTNKALAAASALALGLAPATALAHTNSIGYVGDGGGGITFWYGSWHSGTTFNEAEIKLEGANGTTFGPTITQFTLLQSTTPAGLIPGTNYFTSDGTQLIPYDPTDVNGGGESYTWQGVTFTGLAAGDYTFTYIPLGDAESYNPTGTPTMDWAPMDQVIRSATVTLSSTLLSGDANQNGILDIYEFGTVQQPSTPTLTNSALSYAVVYSVAAPTFTSVTNITHTSSESDGKQTLNFDAATTVTATTVTTTTTTPVTTDTYSDGSTVVTNGTPVVTTSSSSQSAVSHQYSSFSGRIDQLETLEKIGGGSNKLLNHKPSQTKEKVRVFNNNRMMWSTVDGYDAFTSSYGGGLEIDLSKGWTIGGQYNTLNTKLNGTDSTSNMNRDHFGVFNSFHGKHLSLITNGGLSNDKYNYSRNVEGVFNNNGRTEGQQWWVNNRLYAHLGRSVHPFIGHTVRNVTRNAYTESGDPISARSVAAYDNTTHVGEAGLRLETRFGGKKGDLIGISVEGSYATDNSYEVLSAIDINKVVFVEGSHSSYDGVTNNSVAAKVKFRF